MTRAEYEEVRKELAATLIARRASIAELPLNDAARVERRQRVDVLQRCYDVWCKELLPT
jgi:hypothetical protein